MKEKLNAQNNKISIKQRLLFSCNSSRERTCTHSHIVYICAKHFGVYPPRACDHACTCVCVCELFHACAYASCSVPSFRISSDRSSEGRGEESRH